MNECRKIDTYYDLYELYLIEKIKKNDDIAFIKLVNKYKGLYHYLRKYIFSFKLNEDEYYSIFLRSLYESALTFDVNKGTKFKNFFKICFRRRIMDFITYNNRRSRKNKKTLSLDKPIFPNSFKDKQDDEGTLLYEIIHDKNTSDPLDVVIYKETINEFWQFCINEFTELEFIVFKGYLETKSQKAIAKQYNLNPKTVDNALARIKSKINRKYEDKNVLLEHIFKARQFVEF